MNKESGRALSLPTKNKIIKIREELKKWVQEVI